MSPEQETADAISRFLRTVRGLTEIKEENLNIAELRRASKLIEADVERLKSIQAPMKAQETSIRDAQANLKLEGQRIRSEAEASAQSLFAEANKHAERIKAVAEDEVAVTRANFAADRAKLEETEGKIRQRIEALTVAEAEAAAKLANVEGKLKALKAAI